LAYDLTQHLCDQLVLGNAGLRVFNEHVKSGTDDRRGFFDKPYFFSALYRSDFLQEIRRALKLCLRKRGADLFVCSPSNDPFRRSDQSIEADNTDFSRV
jgi:hypothetical protein